MKNDGEKVRTLMKSKGYDIQGLANSLKVTRVAIERDLKKEVLTRRSLVKYLGVLFENIDNFYETDTIVNTTSQKVTNAESEITTALQHKDDLIAAKDEIIKEQRKHIETLTNMLRFFPRAAQRIPLR